MEFPVFSSVLTSVIVLEWLQTAKKFFAELWPIKQVIATGLTSLSA